MSFIKKHKNDILLIAIALLLALGLWLYTLISREKGAEVVVSIDGSEYARLPLDEDARLLLGQGERSNTLVIEGGAAAVTEASCPDHVCISQGWISYSGQTIVCLPNKLVVSIEGGSGSDLDGIAG